MIGEAHQSLTCLPDDRHRKGMEIETVSLLPVLRRLEVQVGGQGAAQALPGLRLLLDNLTLRAQTTADMEANQPPLCEKIGAAFIEEGGIQLVLALLMAGSGNLETNPVQVRNSPDSHNVRLKQLAMDVLCQLCVVNKSAPELLGMDQKFEKLKSDTG